jgi:hypothetical protein
MNAHLRWSKGGEAEIQSVDDDAIVLRSTSPAPPGARLEAVLLLAPTTQVKIKSHGSKRDDDGTFVLRGRLLDASRELRDRLASLLASPTVPEPAKPE